MFVFLPAGLGEAPAGNFGISGGPDSGGSPAWWLRLPGLSQAYDVAAAGPHFRDRLSVSATVWLLRCGQCCGQWCCGKGRQSRCLWSG